MISLFARLTCDVCRATLPENLPGNASWARARARLDFGWRVTRDAAGLPTDRCPACTRAAARAAALAPADALRHAARRFGIDVTLARSQADASPAGITVANYEMLHHFDPAAFAGVVLDESSILTTLKGVTGGRRP